MIDVLIILNNGTYYPTFTLNITQTYVGTLSQVYHLNKYFYAIKKNNFYSIVFS